jgi:FAD/FMN-containing dehydrogenase/Fe-S oxidoreductase
MENLEQALKHSLKGDVHFDPITKKVYSVDASIFEVEPLGVVLPKNKEDLIQTVRLAKQFNIPLTVRGAATGITGGCLGRGLIIDVSKYLNQIQEINLEKGYVICQPGVVQDALNTKLAPFGFRLGPDTSTGNRATLGGMLGNNAAGSRSLRYGKMVDHVQSVELLMANGELIELKSLTEEEWRQKRDLASCEGTLYRDIFRIRESYRDEIEKRFPKIPRRVSGYNLDELIKPGPFPFAKLIAGSEGTLGIVTEMKLAIVPKPKATGLGLLYFHDMIQAMRWIPYLLTYQPSALEMIDNQIINLGRQSPSMRGKMNWLQSTPEALFIVELEGENEKDVAEKLNCFLSNAKQKNIGYLQMPLQDPLNVSHVWTLRKAGLGILLSKREYSRAIAFLEDITVGPEHLASFMETFLAYLKKKNKEAGIYGHVGSGCMHIRPYINLLQPKELALMKQMMHDISDLLLQYGGALSGEHGDGMIRSWLNPKMFGEKLNQAFMDLKKAFDPENRMNPGKIVGADTEPFKDLRLSPASHLKAPQTFLDFSREGGFELAVDLCNGNGRCRKKEGIMCPSFQVDDDEYHTTRARAQALRSLVHGKLSMEDFTSRGLYDVLDLCIQCKGCKVECPSEVDMAKMKTEFLYHFYQKHGQPLRNYLFGYIGYLNWLSSPFARLFNRLSQLPFSKKMLDKLGIASQRQLPPLALQTFSKWFKGHTQPFSSSSVILFNDTFTEFHFPSIGEAAVKILNLLGYRVIVLPWRCCGRPLISKGFLPQAKRCALKVMKALQPYANEGIPILGLEPSCLLTIKEDYPDFFDLKDPKKEEAKAIAIHCLTLDEFLAKEIDKGQVQIPLQGKHQTVLLHGHCHQKALIGTQPTLDVLKAFPNLQIAEIPSGCCGMAGSFGYEKEHYEFSLRIGALKLFPFIENSPKDTWIVANGTSCRSQIIEGTGRQALHLAEFLWGYLKSSDSGIPL